MRERKEKTITIRLNNYDSIPIVIKDKYYDLDYIKSMLDDKNDFIIIKNHIISKMDISSIEMIEDDEEEEIL